MNMKTSCCIIYAVFVYQSEVRYVIGYIEDITFRAEIRNFCRSVEKNISRMSAANEVNMFQHEKRNFVSPSDHVMFFLLYKYQLYKYHSEIVSTWTKAPLRKARMIV